MAPRMPRRRTGVDMLEERSGAVDQMVTGGRKPRDDRAFCRSPELND